MRTLAFPALASLVGVTLLAGCPSRDVSAVDPRQATEQGKEIPINLSRDIDILFVIDNSISMGGEQTSLRANFPAFMDVLEGIEGGLPSVHIAVVSSDMGIGANTAGGCQGDGDGGNFRLGATESCTLTDNSPFIRSEPANYAGTLEDQFSCMANLGTSGCGFEQHLASMKAALDSNANNGDFLREDAYLAVIFIADEDDCSAKEGTNGEMFDTSQDSATSQFGFFSSFRCWEFGVICDDDSPGPREMPDDGTVSGRTNCVPREDSAYMQSVQSYVDFLRNLKGDPNRILVAGILGDPEPIRVQRRNIDDDADLEYDLVQSCGGEGQEVRAMPSTRLSTFLAAFPNRSVFQTICEENLAGALDQIAQLLARVTGTPCLEGDLLDTDPNTDGVQPDCRVSDVQNYGFDNAIETSIPSCDVSGGATPCFRIAPDAAACTGDQFPTQLSITVDYGGGAEPPETTRVVRCAAE